MRLIEVSNKKTERAFHEVPQLIYAKDDNWIPHLRQDIDKIFDPKQNRLFKKGGLAKRWLVRDDNGKWVGRIAAFVSRKYSGGRKQPTGGIGFFESTDDDQVATLLFDVAEQMLVDGRLRGSKGRGPVGLGRSNAARNNPAEELCLGAREHHVDGAVLDQSNYRSPQE